MYVYAYVYVCVFLIVAKRRFFFFLSSKMEFHTRERRLLNEIIHDN